MIMSMRKESGEITADREEILKICANFYKSLCTQTVPTPESTMKSSPDTEEIPEFTEEEVERAIKRMKSDIIKLGGPVVLTYLTNIFNNILKTKQEVFKKVDISEGVNVDGENLTNLRFTDDVALFSETTKQMEKHLNNLNSESLKVGLKIHKGKTKYMTNQVDSEDILIDQPKIEK